MTRASEAAGWYARMRGPDADSSQAAFDKWMRDPANAAAYAQAADDWKFAAGLSRAHIEARSRRAPDAPRRTGWAMAMAMVVIAALALGFSWHAYSPSTEPTTAETARDQLIELADGSRVTLMDGAHIESRFTVDRRRVLLTGGRARFEVAHNETRPFIVEAGGSETKALGTIFEVDLRQALPRVALIAGAVEVRKIGRGAAVRLAPGEAAEVPATGARRISAMQMPAATTMLDAEDLSLGVVVERANAANGTAIRLADPALATLRISGRFDIADSASLARKLAAALDLDVAVEAGTIILSDRAKKSGG